MKVKILIFLYLAGLPFCKAQSHWETVHTFSKEPLTTAPLVWQYKDKLYLYTDKESAEMFKEKRADSLVPFSGEEKNSPEARKDAMQWVTDEGLWLFGGISSKNHSLLADLWLFNIRANKWEEIKQENKGPGPRRGSASWADSKGNLYMFGGYSDEWQNRISKNLNNELWAFMPGDKKWIKLESKLAPTARAYMAFWNVNSSEVLFYGGYGYDKEYTIARGLSDLWRFNMDRGLWTEVEQEKSPVLRSLGIGGSTVHPGGRYKPSFWKDSDGSFWLTFGQSVISSEKVNIEPFLWRLDPEKLTWTFRPVSSDPYILGAEFLHTGADGDLQIMFPSFLSAEREVEVKSQSMQLKLKSK